MLPTPARGRWESSCVLMRAWLRFGRRHSPPSSSASSQGSGPCAARVGSEAYSPAGTTPMRPKRRTSRSSSTRPSSRAHHARTYGSSSPGRSRSTPVIPRCTTSSRSSSSASSRYLPRRPTASMRGPGRERRRRELRRRVPPRLDDARDPPRAAPAAAAPSRPQAARARCQHAVTARLRLHHDGDDHRACAWCGR